MPLPKLPTRMGAMVSATPDTAIPEAPEIKTPATRPAKPAAKRQASVTPAAKVLTPPVPEPPVLSVVATRTERSEEHTSELQSLMRISYAVFCLKKKRTIPQKSTRSSRNEKKNK